MTVLGYLPKLKRGLQLPLGAHFLQDFFYKNVQFNNLSIDKVSISYFFSFSRYQAKCAIKFLFENCDIINLSKAMTDREKKRGQDRNTKI